jgi:hypothetical protein
VQHPAAMLPAPQLHTAALADGAAAAPPTAADSSSARYLQYTGMRSSAQLQLALSTGTPAASDPLPAQPLTDNGFSSSRNTSSSRSASQPSELAEVASASDSSSSSRVVAGTRVEDPLAALSAANPVAAPLIQVGRDPP